MAGFVTDTLVNVSCTTLEQLKSAYLQHVFDILQGRSMFPFTLPYHTIRVLGPTPAPSPTPEPVQAGPLSLGCFNDDGDDRIMDDRALVDTSMTTEVILFRL